MKSNLSRTYRLCVSGQSQKGEHDENRSLFLLVVVLEFKYMKISILIFFLPIFSQK